MRLELTPPAYPVVAGQSISLELRLHTEDASVDLPHDYELRDTVTLALLDAEHRLVAQGDGFARVARTLEPGTRFPRAVPGSTSIPPGETLVWEADLIAYLDPPAPGQYLISASFRVGATVVTSAPIPLHVGENRARWMDVSSDESPIPMVFGVQQLPRDDGQQAIFHVSTAVRPECTMSGGALPIPAGAQPRIAEIGSPGIALDRAFGRYVAWQEAGRLGLMRFDGDRQSEGPRYAELTPPGLVLLGRPAEHGDRISVLGVVSYADRREVHRLDFDLGLAPRGRDRICVLSPEAAPISASRGHDGELCVVAGSASGFPVWVHEQGPRGVSGVRELVSAAMLEGPRPGQRRGVLVGLRADLRAQEIEVGASLIPARRRAPTAFVVASLRDVNTRWLSLLAVPLLVSGGGDVGAWRIDADAGWLPDDDEVTWADMVLDHLGRPVVVVATQQRRLILLASDRDARVLPDVDPTRLEQTRLLVIEGSVYSFHPSSTRGVLCERLSTMPSPL